jgi:glucokinase
MMSKAAERPNVGVDLGGTKVEAALVDAEGRVVTSHRHPTDSKTKGPQGVMADIVACVGECLGEGVRNAVALGVGVAGQIDAATGTVRFAPNLGWRDVPLRAELEGTLRLPVVVVNDVRAATFGEWAHGAGKGVNDLVCLFIGTGIGGGVVSGGQLLEGCCNMAGELGHMTIVAGGRPCHCPNRGCLEAYVGGWAIAERAQDAIREDPKSGRALVALAGSLEQITTAIIAQAYREGDPFARGLIDETGQYLVAGVVGIVNAFNPSALILGGGVIEGLSELVHVLNAEVRSRALTAAVEHLRIVKSTLGGNAGVIGAAALARKRVVEGSKRNHSSVTA